MRTKYWVNLILISVLILATIIRMDGLSTRDIWYDEALDIIQSEKTLSQISHDVQTPLHYYVVHFFLQFGKDTFSLGLPSVIFGVATVYLIYLIGKRFFSLRVGLMSAFLASISPMYIEFSRQILHYSYFNFFTVLGLYFFLDFLQNVNNSRFLKSLCLFMFVSFLNLITHASAFLVLAIEGSFALFYLLFRGQIVRIIRKYYALIFTIIITCSILVLKFGNSGYIKTISDISLDLSKPMKVGYSLSGYLGNDLLIFGKTFIYAIFSWFGIGPGYRFYLYFTLCLMGLAQLFLDKKKTILLLSVYWLTFPFLFLYVFKITHWFEEKYFFFIVPIYLLLIANGLVFISVKITRYLNNTYFLTSKKIVLNRNFILFLQFILTIWIFYLSIYPNSQRTIYGFRRSDDPGYSWNKAISYLKTIIKEGDKIIMRNGEGIFFEFYFDKLAKGKVWFEEKEILSLTPEEYQKLVGQKANIYYASIPDYKDLFLASITDATYLDNKGGFNLYQVTFRKNSPITLKRSSDGNLEYYDDFRTAQYVSDTSNYVNLSSTYSGNYNVPATYGYYNLSPVSTQTASISYHFILPDNLSELILNPKFSLAKNSSIKILAGDTSSSLKTIYTETGNEFSYFNPTIPLSVYKPGKELYLKIELSPNTSAEFLKQIAIKSILLTDRKTRSGHSFPSQVAKKYNYRTELELTRSNKWLFDTVNNNGWDQSLDGVLFNFSGNPSDSPLIYKFTFVDLVIPENLKLKTYTFNDNPISIYYGIDNINWQLIERIIDDKTSVREIVIDSAIKSKQHYLKFMCKNGGPTCQLRDFSVDFIEE